MDNKYVFISYAHKDSEKALSIIQAMKDSGIALWYDEGIEAGTEWPEYIGEKIVNAAVFISFMSPAAAASVNCRNEYNFLSSLSRIIHQKKSVELGCKSAEQEHRRWNAYMRSEEYSFSGSKDRSSRNDLAKLHNNLIPFSELEDNTVKKDQKKNRRGI